MTLRARWRNASLATRLFVLSAVWTSFVLIAAGLSLSAYYRHETQQAFDERLNVYLRALVADVANSTNGDDETTALGDPQFELVASGRYWQITRLDDKAHPTRTSRSLFSAHLPKLADFGVQPEIGGARSGTVSGPGGRELRIVERTIDAGDSGIYLVQVASTTEDFAADVAAFNAALAIIFGMLAIGLLTTTALQVRYGLLPLRELEGAIGTVRRGEQDRIFGQYPRDLSPLAEELNLLIAANQDIVERARVQVGNLAHALKTPLSVLTNEETGDRAALAAKVQEQTAIMRDQVSYYLDRARVAARAGAIGAATDVGPLIEGLLRTFRKIYPDRLLEGACTETMRFLGEKQDLEEMVGNLLDNACKWAPERVIVTVASETATAGRVNIVILIDDDGPGLAPDLRAEAMKRGRRLDETKPGSGLGLSIVGDLAAAYRGDFTLDESAMGGLRATLRLPGVSG